MNMHKLPEKDSRDILTSTAWNALIHHPVGVEEEEGQDLPSTVDMDAIKGAPSTPLTAPPTPWSLADHGSGKGAEDDDSSSSEDDDDDSDGTTRGSSGSDSDDSGSESCSWSTSSSSSSSSEESTPSRQTFSVSKSDIEGSLRLKISATKIPTDQKTSSDVVVRGAAAGTECDNPTKPQNETSNPIKTSMSKSNSKPLTSPDSLRTETKDLKKQPTKSSSSPPTTKLKPIPKRSPVKDSKPVNRKMKSKALTVVKKNESPVKKSVESKPVVISPPRKKITEASRLRTVRKKRGTAASTPSSLVAASSSLRHGRAAACQSSRSSSTTPDSSESEEGEGTHDAAAHITQLAQQLGHLAPPAASGAANESAEPTEALPSMTEHLQVINQEDLAAILPDVVTTETTAGFDGFEDVSSESGKAEKKEQSGNTGADSGSDVELPDQIVSDAIKRIHVDSEDVDNSDSEKDAVKSTPPKASARNLPRSDSGSEGDANSSPIYSSSLLQQFVEKTEILSAQCERLMSGSRAKKLPATSSMSAASRVKKLKSTRSSRMATEAAASAMPELESYRLDCSLSNVSPDSGIQSVPGSPVHDALHADSTPPVLRPISPPENALKKRRGRPKKNPDCLSREAPKLDIPPRLESIPPSSNATTCKRGPGRPKKTPPVLEINPVLSSKSSTPGAKLNLVLNEICERVNRRLDAPTDSSRGIELKDLERIINDHKSTKARNSKIDAIFSKSKKLSNIPNIAIVKPMQYHIVNERNDDDEKQNKKGGKKGKDKEDGLLKLDPKMAGIADELAKIGRDKKKHSRLSKSALSNHNRSGRSARARSRHLSSGTDVSCDKPVDTDAVKLDVRVFKTDRLTKESQIGVPLIEEVAASKAAPVSCAQPASKKSPTKKKPKFLSLHRSLNHQKKKKKKEKKKDEKHGSSEKCLYVGDLEKIINALEKITLEENKKHLPTAPVVPTTSVSPPAKPSPLPAEPRSKRGGKKRKTSEKTKGAEKDMTVEKIKISERESIADDHGKEREKEKPKRKQKKGQETAKDLSEASSPNEQRLPLKKRHYHLTPTSQSLGDIKEADPAEPPIILNERPSGKDSPAARKEVDRARESKKDAAKDTKESLQRVLRSSVEDTIEATINRFSTGSPTIGVESGQRTVIVTPKKRHRVEEDEEAESQENASKEKDKPTATSIKSSSVKVSQSRPTGNSVTDKGGGKAGSASLGREGVIKSVGVIEPKRRSRSSSGTKEGVPEKLSGEKPKRAVVLPESRNKSSRREKRQTRSATKPVDIGKLEPPAVEESPVVKLVTKKDTTAASTTKNEGKSVKQPAAGIFEPSTVEVEIDSSILVPLTSPSEMKSDLKGSLSAKKIKASQSPQKAAAVCSVGEKQAPHNAPASLTEKDVAVKANTDLPVSSLTTAQFILRTSEMQTKARRRRFINRTGFPTARKRKKKFTFSVKRKTADQPVIVVSVEEEKPNVKIVDEFANSEESKNISDVHVEETPCGDADFDEDIPLNMIILDKPVAKISHRIEQKLNAGRLAVKRALKRPEGPKTKKAKLERVLRSPKPETSNEAAVAVEPKKESTSEVRADPIPLPQPTRKRKSSSTIKNTKSQMKSRYQLPLLSMKKYKKAKTEEKVPSEDESEVPETKKKAQPRWRKKYLTAGLLSEHHKVEEGGTLSGKLIEKPLNKWMYNPEEHPFGIFPSPAYCEKYLRRKRELFNLPYDIWWQHANNQLTGRDVVPSWNYRKIRTNVYYDVKPQTTGRNEAQSCSCKPPPSSSKQLGCGDDCINRMVLSECTPSQCPCGDRCSNQRIQRHEYAPGLEKYMTKDKGWGVRSAQPIKAGEFILEYVGEVVSEKEFKERMQSRYVNDTHHYCLHLDGGLVIDGHRMGGDGRFVNHSCEPNCEMQKWTVNGLFRMALFSLRDIPPNQELSYDYNFSLYDPAEGQVCLCHSKSCRGVIGGKSQRVTVPGGAVQSRSANRDRDKKTGRGRKAKAKRRNDKGKTQIETTAVKASMKPMSHQQRSFAQSHRCFLLRNVEKVRRGRDLPKHGTHESSDRCNNGSGDVKPADVFYTQLNALSTLRSIKTRRLAQAEDNPQVAKAAKLAHVFKHLYSAIVTAKDEKDELLAASFMTLPTKKKQPQYYTRIADPIDLTMVEQNINAGKYVTIEAFDSDVNRLLSNNVRFYGRTSELGIAATRLKRTYNIAKLDVVLQLEEILGDSLPPSFLPEKTDPGAEEEDVIRCICGLYTDEGVMIQCERCLVWQHCDCVKEDDSCEHYLCERCEPRDVDYEILMEPVPEYAKKGETYYISLMRGQLQLRLGDTVYVLRDMLEESITGSSPPRKVTYKTAKNVDYADLDIFRIERLYTDEKGTKFAFGHHYLRPHETYHEPSRKFFVNEVMRVPLYETVPLDLIYQHCWVLDLGTFCRGRPMGAPEEHVYICEYRVDKHARLFAKIVKHHTICTKNYAFEKFETKLRPVRTYTPHGSVPSRRRVRGNARQDPLRPDSDEEMPLARVRDHAHAAKRDMQKKRLNKILTRLLGVLPKQQPLDVTYLLEPVKRAARTKSTAKKTA